MLEWFKLSLRVYIQFTYDLWMRENELRDITAWKSWIMNYILIFNVCVYSIPRSPPLYEVSCPSSRWFLIGSHPIAINQSEITCSTSSTFCPLHQIPSTRFPPFLHVPFLHLCCSYPQFPLFPFSVALHFSFHYHFLLLQSPSYPPITYVALASLPCPSPLVFFSHVMVWCASPLSLSSFLFFSLS